MKLKGVADNVLETAGSTPIVRLNNLTTHIKATVCLKLENMNPSGAGNDRIASEMIRRAEEKGLLKNGSTIIEATNGNTGISLAMCGAVMGYRVIATIPDKTIGE